MLLIFHESISKQQTLNNKIFCLPMSSRVTTSVLVTGTSVLSEPLTSHPDAQGLGYVGSI